jgi:hypothetical protein
MSSHGRSGAGLTRPPLNARTSKQNGNCNARRTNLFGLSLSMQASSISSRCSCASFSNVSRGGRICRVCFAVATAALMPSRAASTLWELRSLSRTARAAFCHLATSSAPQAAPIRRGASATFRLRPAPGLRPPCAMKPVCHSLADRRNVGTRRSERTKSAPVTSSHSLPRGVFQGRCTYLKLR